MKQNANKKWNNGFTLVEVLAATAILIILLALGAVGVARYVRLLQITELDNAAREIYMAAENRTVLLTNSGRLETMRNEPTEDKKILKALSASAGAAGDDPDMVGNYYIYYTKDNASVLDELLPEGTIDPALRKGCFYIVYKINDDGENGDIGAASVTDVFYAEDGGILENGSDPDSFYAQWRGASRSERLGEDKMMGYFGSASVDSGSSTPLYEPIVEIINGEELKVCVKYTVKNTSNPATLEAWLTYQNRRIDLTAAGTGWNKAEINTEPAGYGMTTYIYTWVLDTLKQDGPQSKTVFSGLTLGGDFTASARVRQDNVTSRTKSDMDHTLFASNEGRENGERTAYIANLRHLQNLDKNFSEVSGKTAAVQVADIDCGKSIFTDYAFVPIMNDELKSYCGSYAADGAEAVTHFIKGLEVTPNSAADRNGGLFSSVSGEETKLWKFENVCLINTSIKAGNEENGKQFSAGALVGVASNASFKNCWVYWEQDGQDSLDVLLKDDNNELAYQIVGSCAGGMVGSLSGGTLENSLENCLAATLVQGGDIAGGLIGRLEYGKVSVKNSYADCYLTAPTAAGLIGEADTGAPVSVENVYTAGFINKASTYAAGLCNTTTGNTVSAKYAYSAMRYEETDNIEPLAPGVAENSNNCYYLFITNEKQGKSYEDMVKEEFLAQMGAAFGRKGSDQSHPYNLRDGMALTVYPFPGLDGLPHYGDWNTEFVKASLVYFEQYQGKDSAYGFYGGGVACLRDDAVVPVDGYAIVLRDEDLSGDTVKISFEQTGKDNTTITAERTYGKADLEKYKVTHEGKTYYLAPLPDELITTDYADRDFYQYLNFWIGDNKGSEGYTAAYNPHFAKMAVMKQDGVALDEFKASMSAMAAGRMTVSIRTPRHLNELSKHPEYYHTDAGQQRRLFEFMQELDLSYTKYSGYNWGEKEQTQDPIGRQGREFNGRYYGGCHVIEGVMFEVPTASGRSYAGLFGVSTGGLYNIVYRMNPDKPLRVAIQGKTEVYVGALVGGIASGEVVNCAVYDVNLYGVAVDTTIYMGGLAGQNQGIIRGCAAETARLSSENSTYSKSFAGGLVGQNYVGASIDASYAVGYATAEVDQWSEARVCGFAGYNRGTIRSSYAAVRLQSSGSSVVTYGFCGAAEGSQDNTFYLNEGNFEYRDSAYNASYTTAKARSTKYAALTDGTYLTQLKMKQMTAAGTEDVFPYPTGVVDADGKPVHYGQWPEPVKLGEMGVYYWEKLVLNGKESYHVSLLSAVPQEGTGMVRKQYILEDKDRSTGSVVTDYGYGYYSEETTTVTVSAQGIMFSNQGGQGQSWTSAIASDAAVDVELKALMPGYTFHSYHTFVPNPNPNDTGNFKDGMKDGLYATGATGSAPNGTVTLTQNGTAVTFKVNPHFADALAVKTLPTGWTQPAGEITVSPGNAGNPYEVRAMGQLSAINWNSTNRDTKTVINGNQNYSQFPYLSYKNNSRDYVWKQTHDIQGNDATYTPIAEYYDCGENGGHGNLYGWFSGSFDGDDYVIENVNIQGQTSSVAGLFGVVFNGSLKNIVLYSSDGQGKITNKIGNNMDSAWYSMGTLAGIASAQQGADGYKGSAVENCSASGYTIEYKTYNRRDKGSTNDVGGGSTVGGLLGASDMALKNCSAVTDIKILKGDAKSTFGNDNLRVAGLTGVCQNEITNCYAGGNIEVANGVIVKKQNGIFLGGIVGGGYFKPLTVKDAKDIQIGGGGQGGNTGWMQLTDCYSYVALPDEDTVVYTTTGDAASNSDPTANGGAVSTHIRALYAIGGPGDGTSVYTAKNCYYLKSEVMKNNPDGVTMTMPYNDGNGGTFRLRTDLDLTRDSVQEVVLRADGKPLRVGGPDADGGAFVERRIPLTTENVDKEFLLSYNAGKEDYTYHSPEDSLKINIDGKDYWCIYRTTASNCMPIFTINTAGDGSINNNSPTSDSKWVTFRGWATGISGNTVTGLTTDPTDLTKISVNDWNSLMAVTYDQLKVKDEAGAVLKRLDAFSPVTDKTEEGFDIPGKYSYSSADYLGGLRYPFPTILTREGGKIHVHYGNWPLNGIERDKGAEPIRRSLFSTKEQGETETLKLSEGVAKGGTWAVTSNNEAIATAEITPNGELSVTGIGEGVTSIEVSYTVDGVTYPLSISVRVTAVLELHPEYDPVYLLTDSETSVPLRLTNEDGDTVDLAAFEGLALNIEGSSLGYSALLEETQLEKREDDSLWLNVRSGAAEGSTSLSIILRYSYKDKEYSTVNSVTYRVVKPVVSEPEKTDGKLKYTFDLPADMKEAGYKVVVTDGRAINSGAEVYYGDPVENWILLDKFDGLTEVNAELRMQLFDKDGKQVGGDHIVMVTVPIPQPEPEPPVEPEETAAPEPPVTPDDTAAPELGQAEGPGLDASAGLEASGQAASRTGTEGEPRMGPARQNVRGRRTLHAANKGKAEKSKRGVDFGGAAVLPAVRHGGGDGADGGGVQHG